MLWNVNIDWARKDVGKAGYIQLLSISCPVLWCFLGDRLQPWSPGANEGQISSLRG